MAIATKGHNRLESVGCMYEEYKRIFGNKPMIRNRDNMMKFAREVNDLYGAFQSVRYWVQNRWTPENEENWHLIEQKFRKEYPKYDRAQWGGYRDFEGRGSDKNAPSRTSEAIMRLTEITCDVMYEYLLAKGHIAKDEPGW